MYLICASCKKVKDEKGYWGQIEHHKLPEGREFLLIRRNSHSLFDATTVARIQSLAEGQQVRAPQYSVSTG